MTQQITAQLLKGGLTVDASGNVTAIGTFVDAKTGTIKASDGTTAITIADSTGVVTVTSPVINTGVSGSAILDENAMGSNSDTKLATQKSIKAYIDGKTHLSLIDEDNMATDSNTRPPSQQSVKAYVDAAGIPGISSTGATSTDTVTIAGNLTVDGLTTIINSTTLSVDDKNIEMGSVDTPTDGTADGGGIILKGATDKTILWTNSTDSWDFNQGINIEGATSNLATFTSDLTIAANYSMAVIGPVTIPNVTVNGNLNVMTKLDVTGNFNIGSTGLVNIIG